LAAALSELVGGFLAYRGAAARSPFTIANDKTALERFLGWLEKERPQLRSLAAIDRKVFEEYAVWLALYEGDKRGRLKAATRFRHLLSLQAFFHWLSVQGRILSDPSRDLTLPKVPERLPRGILSLKEVGRVLEAPDGATPLGLRNRAIVEVLYSTGIRNTELRSLNIEDLNLTDGFVTVRRGKGGRGRVIPLGEVAGKHVERYLKEARPKFCRSRREPHLFLSRRGTPILPEILRRILKKVGDQADLGKTITPHVLRHTCATHLLQGGADVRYVQELLGHKHLTSTEVYTHVTPTDLKRVHRRCHPRERDRR
jgi:integrase/recombinase XerD